MSYIMRTEHPSGKGGTEYLYRREIPTDGEGGFRTERATELDWLDQELQRSDAIWEENDLFSDDEAEDGLTQAGREFKALLDVAGSLRALIGNLPMFVLDVLLAPVAEIQRATCRNCGKPLVYFAGTWCHEVPEGEMQRWNGQRGCRSASFREGSGWDESLKRDWVAKP